jgi:acyl carrier protein
MDAGTLAVNATNGLISERIQQVAADVLRVPAAEITAESSPASLPGWDSLQQLNLVLALEQEFAVSFEPEEIEQMTSIGQIAVVVSRRL